MTNEEHLTAIEEIRQLKARYFRFLDTKDWVGLESVFTPDATIDFRESMGQAADEANTDLLTIGGAALVQKLRPVMKDVVSVHQGFMPEITIEGADSARGIWAMAERLKAADASPMPFTFMDAWGHYHERYRRSGRGWQIEHLKLTRLRVEMG